MLFWELSESVKTFENSWGNSYLAFLFLIIMPRFNCGENEIRQNIKVPKYYDHHCNDVQKL